MFSSIRSSRPRPADEPFVRPSADQLRRLFRYLVPYRGWMTIAVIALTFGAALGLVFPWVMQTLVDAVLTRGDLAQLNRITAVLIFVFLVRSVFYYFQGYSLSYVGERVVVDLRRDAYTHLHRLSLRFYADRRVGELV